MAFVNLPPNLQDIFGSINDRIAKLETGPNQAMYTAESAQGGAQSASAQAASAQASALSAQNAAAAASAQALSAQTAAATASAQATQASAQAVTAQATANTALLASSVASAQAITANNTANAAASQATIAQSQATIASSQATQAQTSANGKNNNYYSTSAPGSTANVAGDIWYQYGTTGTYANKVIAQWTGAGGTSWTPVTVSGLVIANIDAGSITTGTLSAIQISAGTGGTSFTVSPSGYMQAQGAYIVGNITAQSGTFNGQVNATSGYFGSPTNGWQINAGGIAGLGSGYISGGAIQGTSFNNGNGTFFVNSSGDLVAQSVYVKGAVLGTSGYFGNVSNGWNIDSSGITGIGSGYIAGGAIQGTTVTGGIVQTSAGSNAVVMDGPNNALGIKYGGTYAGWLLGIGSGAFMMHYGTSPSTTAYPRVSVSSTTSSLAADGSNSLSVTTSGNNMQGAMTFGSAVTMSNNLTVNSYIYNPGYQVSTAGGAARINDASTPTARLVAASGSSIRFKKDVVDINTVSALDPKLLLTVPIKAFRYRDDYLDVEDERSGVLVPGFIAEELDAIYPVAVDHDIQGRASRWSSDFIVPSMLALIQDQDARLKILEGK